MYRNLKKPFVSGLAAICLLWPTSSFAAERQPQAVKLLQAAREAARSVDTASFRFVNGHAKAHFGWVEGTVKTKRVAGDSGGRIRVDGKFHPQPQFGRAEGFEFRFARNHHEAAEWRSNSSQPNGLAHVRFASDPATANALQSNASYGFLPELFEESPYWKELDLATGLEMAGTLDVGGVLCDVVRTTLDSAYGPVHQDWYIARSDRLPRGLLWWAEARGQRMEMPFYVYDLKTGITLGHDTFELVSAGTNTNRATATAPHQALVGRAAPPWSLRDAQGRAVNLADFRGQVVVLDFWNTSCYLCHNALPQIASLADQLSDQPVTFLALDVWERGDAVKYWQQRGFSPRLLLEADEVATAYGISGQPAVVVIGPDGNILHSRVGFTADRTQHVQKAIERGTKLASK